MLALGIKEGGLLGWSNQQGSLWQDLIWSTLCLWSFLLWPVWHMLHQPLSTSSSVRAVDSLWRWTPLLEQLLLMLHKMVRGYAWNWLPDLLCCVKSIYNINLSIYSASFHCAVFTGICCSVRICINSHIHDCSLWAIILLCATNPVYQAAVL